MKRPNFVFIITDQQRADHLGCAGNEVLRTPNIDALASRGTRFDRFYVASPICTPNRVTLLTGRMSSAHGVRTNGVPMPLSTTTFVDLLRAQGYRTAVVGKMHVQKMTAWGPIQERPEVDENQTAPPPHLAEARMPAKDDGPYDQESLDAWRNDPEHDVTLPYYGFDHVRICLMHGDQAHGHYGRWLEEKHPGSDSLRGESMLRGGDNVLPSDLSVPFGWRTRVPEELYPTAYVAEESIAFLDEHAKRDDEAPFFLKCSFPDPHHPYTPPGRYFDMYAPEGIALPPSFSGNEDPLPPSLEFLRAQRDGNRKLDVSSFWGMAVNEREAREAIALTYGQVTMIDDAVGRILAHLEKLGLAPDTVVVFTSDHGDYMGDHQLLMKGPLHYQGLIRVPFIWSDPLQPPAEPASDALCGSLDFAQTVLDRAGLQPFHGMQGKSLLPLLNGSESALYEDILIEDENQLILYGFPGHPRARTLVTKQWRMTLFDRVDWGELYDLENDPDEMQNRWDDGGYVDVKRTLMEAMVRKMMDYDDRSPFPTSRS